MVALVSNRIRFEEERNTPAEQSPQTGWWHKGWHAFAEWLMEPIPFPGKWPECNPAQQRYNRDKEAMIQSSNKSPADVQ
jgi:hypothetical protein